MQAFSSILSVLSTIVVLHCVYCNRCPHQYVSMFTKHLMHVIQCVYCYILLQVFSPVLCRPPGSAYMSLRHVQDLVRIQRVVLSLMINHAALNQKDVLLRLISYHYFHLLRV
jgi:hypothetical protein